MQTETGSARSDDDCSKMMGADAFTCSTCGKTSQEPILARVSTGRGVQTYRACPRCFTKVSDIPTLKREDRRPKATEEAPVETGDQAEGEFACEHFFGYLCKREKGTAIPEQCLVCPKMVECLGGY